MDRRRDSEQAPITPAVNSDKGPGTGGAPPPPGKGLREFVARILRRSSAQELASLTTDELATVAASIDSLTADISSSRAELEEQNRFNALRAEIWQAAIDSPRTETSLIEHLLTRVGPAFSVARASYYEREQESGDAVCTVQWCAPGMKNTLRMRIPARIYKLFGKQTTVSLSMAQARQTDPWISRYMEDSDIGSFLAIHYPDITAPRGFISFSHSSPNHRWTDRDIQIIAEVVKIVSVCAGRYRAEEALLQVNERLERRIRKRTSDLHDMVERLRGELAARKEEQELLDVTLRSIADAVITTDGRATILLMNAVAEKLTGVRQADAVGKPLDEVLHLLSERSRKRSDSPLKRAIESGILSGSTGGKVCVARDGTERIIADSAAPIRNRSGEIVGGVLILRDITDQQKLENELFKARKLESIGVLAGGIAHDFNNILTGIVTNLFMAKMSGGEELQQLISDAEKAAMRAGRLTKQLMTFSRGGSLVKENASIRELIRDSVGFCLSGSNVDYRLELPDDLRSVEVDRGQIDQVLNNLVVNADQAMPDGGTITIRGENVHIDDTIPSGTAYGLPLRPGPYVKISIRDEGIGIPPRDLERIFDPYFTTKQTGSGLGLTTAYAIIKRHGGYLTAKSRLGEGSTFVFYLPALEEKDGGSAEPVAVDVPTVSGNARILVMDDDEVVRSVVHKLLTRNGYQVSVALDGQEAVDIYRAQSESGAPFDLVIMDLTIPGGMGGKPAVRKLLEFDPHARVIVFSGYSNDPVLSDYSNHGFCAVITKPFSIHEFSKVIGSVLKQGKKPTLDPRHPSEGFPSVS